MEKNLDRTKPRSSEQILPVPRGSTVLTEDKVFMSPTGNKTDSSTSLEQRRARQYLHCLVVLSISTVTVIKPATSRSTVESSCGVFMEH